MISPKGPVYQAGTLSGNPLAMFMGLKLLTYLKEHREVYKKVEEYGAKLEAGMRKLLVKHGLHYQIHRVGSLLCLFFTEQEIFSYDDVKTCDTNKFSKYFQSMLEQGILLAPSQFEAMFVSAVHTEEDLEKTLLAMDHALTACEA